jgi:hypothetical protein
MQSKPYLWLLLLQVVFGKFKQFKLKISVSCTLYPQWIGVSNSSSNFTQNLYIVSNDGVSTYNWTTPSTFQPWASIYFNSIYYIMSSDGTTYSLNITNRANILVNYITQFKLPTAFQSTLPFGLLSINGSLYGN